MGHTRSTGILILFPGALGDFLCALPTFCALRAQHDPVMLVANGPALELVAGGAFLTASMQRREVADLFADGTATEATRALFAGYPVTHSWTGYADARFAPRLKSITGGEVFVHPFRGMRAGEHATDYYARCAHVSPQLRAPTITAADQRWAADWVQRHRLLDPVLVVHPGSGGARKNWQGFHELVSWWTEQQRTAVVLLGPAEAESARQGWSGADVLADATIGQVAALLRHASLYVGNDSGISHVSAALGTPSLVLFGPSDPTIWAPRGPRVRILTAPTACSSCGPDRLCIHRLPTAAVIDAVTALAALD